MLIKFGLHYIIGSKYGPAEHPSLLSSSDWDSYPGYSITIKWMKIQCRICRNYGEGFTSRQGTQSWDHHQINQLELIT